jgi:hypothetical protein
MVRLCGAALGFLAFATTVFLGLITGNPTEDILIRALQALFLFFFLGLFVGWIAYRVVDEYAIRRHREMFPDGDDLETPAEPAPMSNDGSTPTES